MFKDLLNNYFNQKITNAYSNNSKLFGYSPRALFWNSSYNQKKRFEELLNIIFDHIMNKKISISDVGCGFGSMYEFIKKSDYDNFEYHGVDINEKFIKFCKKKYPYVKFKVSNKPIHNINYSVMSGTYNYTLEKSIKLWESYVIYNLKQCWDLSNNGIVFNIQINCFPKINNNIFYTSFEIMEELLIKNFGKVKSYKSKYFKKDAIFLIEKNN